MTSKVKVNTVETESGSTLTLGKSGDTVTLASGASQSGFGRTGTVNWDTTKKTAAFTAVSGNGYFVDTTSAAITVTLPASPSGGDIVAVKDYAQTFSTNNCTIARNSSNIEGIAENITLDGDAESVTFVYVDSTKGWVLVNESTTKYGPSFVAATGGTVTTSGNFKIHTFTSPGCFVVTCGGNSSGSNTVDYLVVAGGGGGGGDRGGNHGAGGGGAGGFRLSNSTCMPSPQTSPLASPSGLPVSAQTYPITVGGGGAGGGPGSNGSVGSNSVFSTITAAGGGTGGGTSGYNGGNGGSGGGTGGGPGTAGTGGSGNTPPTTPAQGTDGGDDVITSANTSGGGGGGASAVGGDTTTGNNAAGCGGLGAYVVSTGFAGCNGASGATYPWGGTYPGNVCGARYFAGGGGGGSTVPSNSEGYGGIGGGGDGACRTNAAGCAGTANTGGGGGGGNYNPFNGQAGGSGIVIIRYKFQ